jgi:hypothetical protein
LPPPQPATLAPAYKREAPPPSQGEGLENMEEVAVTRLIPDMSGRTAHSTLKLVHKALFLYSFMGRLEHL